VDILKQYIERANEIIGERTPDEQKYDGEVIRLAAQRQEHHQSY